MNEIYIANAHIYFKGNGNAEDVYRQLQEICFQNGIELSFSGEVVLRDEDGNDIDEYKEV